MTEAELLQRVKNALGITGNYQDETIKIYLQDIREYMLDAGVPAYVVDSTAAVGAFVRGVADLWNYGSGSVVLSQYFKERVIQMAANTTVEPTPTPTEDCLPLAGGTMQGDINMDSHKITNLAEQSISSTSPQPATTDAATIGYVQQLVGYLQSLVLLKTGGTLDGYINMDGNPILGLPDLTGQTQEEFNSFAVSKVYVDKAIEAIPSPASTPNDIRVVDFVTLGASMGATSKIETGVTTIETQPGANRYTVGLFLDIFPDVSDIADNLQYNMSVTTSGAEAQTYTVIDRKKSTLFVGGDSSFVDKIEWLMTTDDVMHPSIPLSYIDAEKYMESMAEDFSSGMYNYSLDVRIEKTSVANSGGRNGERLRIIVGFEAMFSGDMPISKEELEQSLQQYILPSIAAWRITYKNSKTLTFVAPNDSTTVSIS